MALSIDEMRAKMNSIAAGAPVPVVKLEDPAKLAESLTGSAAVEALRNQLLGKLVTPVTPKMAEATQEAGAPKSHQELLEQVINNQIRAVKEEASERDQLRERVGSARLDLIGSIL